MKRLFGSVIFISFLIWSLPVFAVPSLQLDIGGGYYNQSGDPRYDDQTVIAPGDVFTLYALMEVDKNKKDPKTTLADTYYISMALFPNKAPLVDYGSFLFNGQEIDVPGDMTPGNPGLPPHGIFDTYYFLFNFKFNSNNTVGTYNTQYDAGNFAKFSPGTGLYYAAFNVDTTKLSDAVSIHFDLFNDKTKAPFSHDADADADAQSDPPVPEPATLILLGSGLVGLAMARRKRGKK